MIRSFGDRATEDLYHARSSARARRFPVDVRRIALRKLDLLNAAAELRDLREPPGNRLKTLKGDWRGFQSIRVNDQWRIVFRWEDSGAWDVALTDYH